MYLIPLALFFVARGRDYYLAPAYPMLFAGGALGGEKWVEPLPATRANAVHGTTWQAMAIAGALTAAILLPIAPPNSVWWRIADNLQGNFHYEFGWREMTDAVARVRDSLPTRDRSRLGVLAADAGEAGALNLHGPAYGLPTAISGSNSHWLGGYGDPSSARTLIAVGFLRAEIEPAFESCQWAGHFETPYGIVNDTIRDRTDSSCTGIYVRNGRSFGRNSGGTTSRMRLRKGMAAPEIRRPFILQQDGTTRPACFFLRALPVAHRSSLTWGWLRPIKSSFKPNLQLTSVWDARPEPRGTQRDYSCLRPRSRCLPRLAWEMPARCANP